MLDETVYVVKFVVALIDVYVSLVRNSIFPSNIFTNVAGYKHHIFARDYTPLHILICCIVRLQNLLSKPFLGTYIS